MGDIALTPVNPRQLVRSSSRDTNFPGTERGTKAGQPSCSAFPVKEAPPL